MRWYRFGPARQDRRSYVDGQVLMSLLAFALWLVAFYLVNLYLVQVLFG